MASRKELVGEDAFGFELDKPDLSIYQQFQSKYMPVLARRAARWDSTGIAKKGRFHKNGKSK